MFTFTPNDLALYLDRLGLPEAPPATADGLATLQHAHLGAIPFENIDPFLGRVPDLSPEALTKKLLQDRRGGYCYEQNSLFGAALAACGFTARRALCRVRQRRPFPGARSHLAWLVMLDDGTRLADTGFGGPAPRAPLRLAAGEQRVANGSYRLTRDESLDEHVLERRGPDGWEPLYSFDGAHVTDEEVAAANHVAATWENSVFPGNLLIAGMDGATRLGLFNRALTEDGPDGLRKSVLASPDDLSALFARLGLNAGPDMTARIWARLAEAPVAGG
ncbi:arylamine N-acetyltransferase [Psychromarinibacter sp. C21-152]|uniref:Arylamine N-acetyltransferase n=1 Tax=Psychromarinibacter sediminicola TaxID=3033385 RepID=A0AAE3T783_9RHOB|nr:arylamine N-acetyltransferase [Psychromarinibacter sediminicola]MDF0600052.1 arylamine N-acetyltransferase [Psychromarinibacter sediminicola]